MKAFLYKLGRILGSLAMGAFFGFFLLLAFIFAMLGGIPSYFITSITALLALALVLFTLNCMDIVPAHWMRRLWLLTVPAAVVACGFISHGVWQDRLPTVSETNILQQYMPYSEGNKLVKLDAPASLQFSSPVIRMDGATALYPVYAAFAQAVYPADDYPLYDGGNSKDDFFGTVTCSGTEEAYERLIRGATDVIFAAAPSQEQLEQAKAAGKELHLTPIGKDAFVFFVNSRNPVTGLTLEQIQGIYTGEITNWKQVGGRNQAIRPFQRRNNSGSQTTLQKLMGDLPLMEPETENVVSAMDGIIHRTADYRNHRNAIGYSFRFYATEMAATDQIRLLAVNGVEPTPEAIRDGSYPLSSIGYAITASIIGTPAPEETNPELGALLEWILSDEGQELVERTGYVSLR